MSKRSFWNGRKVFLTGHTGFKGSWLTLWLDALGADVTGYALAPPTTPSLFEQAGVAKSVRSVAGDIRDFTAIRAAIAECKPDVVIHMAAQSVVRRGYDDPIETYSSNVMGTVNLFEALRQLQQPCVVVNVTSDKCYENNEWPWAYRENDRLGGRDPYSNSKACAELVTSAFRHSYFRGEGSPAVPVVLASARAGNVVGGGDWTRDQLIPDLIRAFLRSAPCSIRSPHAIRPWQFVLEPLRGCLDLAQKLCGDPVDFASAWNFGPAETDARPVSWVANELTRLWGAGAAWNHDTAEHPHEAHYLKLDVSKTNATLDWHPVLGLSVALEWIVEWYRAFQKDGDLARLTREQIRRYEALLAD